MLPYNFNDILRLRFMGSTNGEQFQLVQHFRAKQAIVSVIDFQNALTTGFLSEFRALMCVTTEFTSVGHARVRPSDDDEEQELPIAPVVGLRPEPAMPNQIAHLLKTRTGLDAQSGRGRLYLPGVPMDHFFMGRWTLLATAVQTQTAQRVKEWVAEGGNNAWLEWGVASYQTEPLSYNPVKEVFFSSYPATMRSRRPTST